MMLEVGDLSFCSHDKLTYAKGFILWSGGDLGCLQVIRRQTLGLGPTANFFIVTQIASEILFEPHLCF